MLREVPGQKRWKNESTTEVPERTKSKYTGSLLAERVFLVTYSSHMGINC